VAFLLGSMIGCGSSSSSGDFGPGSGGSSGGGGSGGSSAGGSGGSVPPGQDNDGDGFKTPQDCNDQDPNVHPGVDEVCDGVDNDCNGQIDDGVSTEFYIDQDKDGWGVDDPSTNKTGCVQPDGYTTKKGDCNDAAWAINPDQVEIWGNDQDENCDGVADKCLPGALSCDGSSVKQCDATGGWGPSSPCSTGLCVDVYGCVVCNPSEATCIGNTLHKCQSDGSGYVDYDCDPLIGSSCDQNRCTGPCAPDALGRTYIGCDYYPTVTINSQIAELGGFDNFHYAVAISNTTTDTANITITQGSTTITTTTVAPGSVQVVPLPWTSLRTAGATTTLPSGAYRLRSTQPVTVYQFNPLEYMVGGYGSYTNDASILIPVTAWGKRYMVASRNTWEWNGFNIPGFYAVVAGDDGTTVNITPSATGQAIRPGAGLTTNQGSVVLNRGDVLQVLSATPTSSDLTGTIVESDKPIQVISGHSCTFVPANVGYCDHLEESMFPVNTLAEEYIVSPPSLPTLPQPKPFFVRVIAAEPNITVQYDPAVAAPTNLTNIGDYVEVDSGQAFRIAATGRILVSQYMKGQDAGGNSGDPAMALAVTTSQFRKSYLFHSPVNYEYNYANIIAPAGAQVTLDGSPVTNFEAVSSTGFGVARVSFPNGGDGNHRIEADQRVGVTVYGYGQYTSYWYPGGLNLTELP